MNPFDWPGPAFLSLYIPLLVAALVTAFVLRWLLRAPVDDPPVEAGDLSPYEIAFLAGGERAATDAAIVRLVHRGVLELDWTTGQLFRRGEGRLTDAHPLEHAIDNAAGTEPGKKLADVRLAVKGVAGMFRSRLEELGLLVQPSQANVVCMASSGVMILAGLFGLVKFFVALQRPPPHRPVVFLLALLIGTAIAAVVFLVKRPLRSRRGDTLLGELKHDNAALQYAASKRVSDLSDADLVLAMGLFGVGALAGGPLGRLQASLRSPTGTSKPASTTSGSTCSSTCGTACGGGGGGGAGCGGGGGCGGGCGGGGCGGCGG